MVCRIIRPEGPRSSRTRCRFCQQTALRRRIEPPNVCRQAGSDGNLRSHGPPNESATAASFPGAGTSLRHEGRQDAAPAGKSSVSIWWSWATRTCTRPRWKRSPSPPSRQSKSAKAARANPKGLPSQTDSAARPTKSVTGAVVPPLIRTFFTLTAPSAPSIACYPRRRIGERLTCQKHAQPRDLFTPTPPGTR